MYLTNHRPAHAGIDRTFPRYILRRDTRTASWVPQGWCVIVNNFANTQATWDRVEKGVQFNLAHSIDNHNSSYSCRGWLLSDVQSHAVNLYWRSGKNCLKTSCALMKVRSTFSQCIVKMAGRIKECAHGSVAILFMGLGVAHVLSTIEKVLTFTQLLPPPCSYHWWSHLQSYQSRQL